MRSKTRKNVHKRLKNKKGTNTQEKSKSPVVSQLPPVPHTFWVRPNYSEAHRMYTIKKMNEKGKTLIVMYRKNKHSLDKIYKRLVDLS
jgi:hypothetical protein